MNSSEIFTLALGLAEPWYVSKVELIEGEQSKKELHLWLSFTRGYRFTFGTKGYLPSNRLRAYALVVSPQRAAYSAISL